MAMLLLSAASGSFGATPQSELFQNFKNKDSAPSAQSVQRWRQEQEERKRMREKATEPSPSTPSNSPQVGGFRNPTQKASGAIQARPLKSAERVPHVRHSPAPGIDGSKIPTNLSF